MQGAITILLNSCTQTDVYNTHNEGAPWYLLERIAVRTSNTNAIHTAT